MTSAEQRWIQSWFNYFGDRFRQIIVMQTELADAIAEIVASSGDDARMNKAALKLQLSNERLRSVLASAGTAKPTHRPYLDREFLLMANQTVDSLLKQVQDATSIEESCIVFVTGVPKLISDAVAKAMENGATAEQLAPVTEAGNLLSAKSDALAAVIAANTPVSPEMLKARNPMEMNAAKAPVAEKTSGHSHQHGAKKS